MQSRPIAVPVRCCDTKDFRNNSQTRPKKIWWETCKIDKGILGVDKDMITNRAQWRIRIHTADPT